MNTTLLIMAAGIGSRYGGGIKQLAQVDSGGHIIMDYSIHDAIRAGFRKIVFVIRRDIEQDFREVIGDRIEAVCRRCGVEVHYAFQDLEDIPKGEQVPEGRKKPWGTGQAVLSAREIIHEPFAIINADDYYGTEAFVKIHNFLIHEAREDRFCMAGFVLKNTLSDYGAVTRGLCEADADGWLTSVRETTGIEKREEGVFAGNCAVDPECRVSMNMWGLMPGFLDTLGEGFQAFFRECVAADPLKAEYLIPVFIGKQLAEGRISVKLLQTGDKWFGVTYQEDRESVARNIAQLIDQGIYHRDLYADLYETVKL